MGILFIFVFWQSKNLVIVGFCIFFLILGIWRHQQAQLRILNNELRKYNDSREDITLIGVISAEPDFGEKSQKLTIKVEKLEFTETRPWQNLGKVLVITRRYPEYQYGERLKITGELKTPSEDLEGFNYQDYLKKDGIYSVIYWPKIELIERNQGNWFYAKVLKFKNKLRESIYQNLSPPQSSILGAMILGDKKQISEDLKQKLNLAGVRHITAISGLHVTTLTSILMTILIGLGFWRQQAFWFSIILITLFVVMTGLQPSAIRAGIMGGIFLFAQYLGRMNASSRSLIFVAALMLIQNPLLLKLDIGFQLSFLAMLGIIYLLPFFRDWLKFIPEEKLINLRSVLAMTLSAQVFTLPILIYNFGYMSLVAPITNILIVPLLPYIMGLGFLFALAGTIFQFLGWVLSWPAWPLLTYLIKVIDFFSRAPKIDFAISWIWLIIVYSTLGLITWRLHATQKLKFLQY